MFITRTLAAVLALVPILARAQVSTTNTTRHARVVSVDGQSIIEPRTLALTGSPAIKDALEPSIAINPVGDTGYDIVYTFRNDTGQAKPLSRLVVGTLALGPKIEYLSVHRGSKVSETTHDSFISQAWRYPSEAYSPVTVLMNDRVAVGVSLIYPVLEYKHDALVGVNKAGGAFKGAPGREGWFVSFDLSSPPYPNPSTVLAYPASLDPSESRTYTVAVRTIKRSRPPTSPTAAQDWLETLTPYRDHFQSICPGVTYTRNPAPVLAKELANISALGSRNPRGLLGDRTSRPDLAGFGPVANLVANQRGFTRTMLWAPSGVYDKHRKNNFPPNFTLAWDDFPLLRTTHHQLTRIPETGKQLGLWWGRSTQHTREWDPEKLEDLDLTNREHLRTIVEQIALAREAGATMIGMDNLIHQILPVWDQLRLIRALRRTYPEITFIAEPMCCDLVHAEAPGFISAFTTPPGAKADLDFHKLKAPHYIADFLLPGHETWAYFRYSEITKSRIETISPARMQSDADHLARNGYVPVIITVHGLTNNRSATAAETWRTTVPAHLQQTQKATGAP